MLWGDPKGSAMRVAVASDHTAMELRQEIIDLVRGLGHEVSDLGTHDPTKADYPATSAMRPASAPPTPAWIASLTSAAESP